MLEVGSQAPNFIVQSTAGPLELADLLQRGPVVLYFFPKAFTPG